MLNETELNGINLQEIKEAFEAVAATPGASKGRKTSRVRWLGGLKLKALVRNHTFLVDEPTHLTGEDEAPNAMEYVLGALGACYLTGFVLNASKRGIPVYNAEVTLESTQDNVFQFLGINDEGHSGFDAITAKLYVESDADQAALQEIWERTLRSSPVGNSLERSVPIKPELVVV